MDKQLATFTNDSLQGRRNPEMDALLKEFSDEVQPIFDKFIKKCIKKNIEYCSINGALYEELGSLILSARLQTTLDLCEEKESK